MLQKACQELYISHKELERKIEELRAWNTEALAENNKLDRQLDVFFEVLREVCTNDKMKAKELRAMLCKVLDEHSALFDAAIIEEEVEP
jgi:chorismate mutase